MRSKYQGFTQEAGRVIKEHYRPRGQDGIAITIRYTSKLSPDGVRRWRPTARLAAIMGTHTRERVKNRRRGPDGSRMGPGKISGAMWASLKTSITAKGRARVYFSGSSVSYMRSSGGMVARKDSTGKPIKVKNELKAKNVSGLGYVPRRDDDGKFIRSSRAFEGEVPRSSGGKFSGLPRPDPPRDRIGRFSPWDEGMPSMVDMIPQRFASGRHRPVSVLEPSVQERVAAMSVIQLGIERIGMTGKTTPSTKLRGDSRLVSRLRRGLGV